MYRPRAFAESDLRLLDALVARDPFVTLTTVGTDGLPFASHLPVLYRRDGATVTVEGHWARPNPQCGHAGPALMIVHGPHAYVSASWYPDKEQAARVPTWNYAVAHLTGTLQRVDDDDALGDIVSRLSARHEAESGSDWQFEPQRAEHARQLRGIVGFRFVPERIELKFKLSQNHPPANIAAVIDALERQPAPFSHQVAALMRDRERGPGER